MKFIFTKVICLFLLLFVFNTVFAQAPQKMSYQAVIRNTSGNLIVDTPVGIKIAILQGSTSGTEVFSETHNPTTSSNGLASIEIGAGSPITGTFATINWGLGPFFIKTETDPTGGTNYTISGTSQLLSVPYALYAEKTKFQGKNSIYIHDYISNAEAQAILQEQFGPNTENIYIRDTKGLTSIDLSMVSSLVNLEITNNKNLNSVTADNLTKCNNQIYIYKNDALTQLNLSTYTEGDFILKDNGALLTFQLPQFTKGNINLSSTDFDSDSAITSFQMPQFSNGSIKISKLKFLQQIYLPSFNSRLFEVQECTALTSINLPSVTFLENLQLNGYHAWFGNLENISLPNLTSVLLPSLNSVSESFYINGPLLTTLTYPALTNVKYFSIVNTHLTNLNTQINSGILVYINKNNFLQSVNFGALVSANAIDCSYNPLLTSINLSSLSSLAGSATNYSYFSFNALPSSQINAILHQLLSVSPSVPKTVLFKNQTPLAPPTGVGITDKATLISQGNNITTD